MGGFPNIQPNIQITERVGHAHKNALQTESTDIAIVLKFNFSSSLKLLTHPHAIIFTSLKTYLHLIFKSLQAEKMENLFLYNLQPTSTKSPPCMQASYDSESFKSVKRRFKKIKIFFNYISYV